MCVSPLVPAPAWAEAAGAATACLVCSERRLNSRSESVAEAAAAAAAHEEEVEIGPEMRCGRIHGSDAVSGACAGALASSRTLAAS